MAKKLSYPFSGDYRYFQEVNNSDANHLKAQGPLQDIMFFRICNDFLVFLGILSSWVSWDYSQFSDSACSSDGPVDYLVLKIIYNNDYVIFFSLQEVERMRDVEKSWMLFLKFPLWLPVLILLSLIVVTDSKYCAILIFLAISWNYDHRLYIYFYIFFLKMFIMLSKMKATWRTCTT